jgi:hypothetical protein
MSSSIWMQCAGGSRVGQFAADPWRVVESQHQVSTRKLVDSDREQQVLEQLIESAKPPTRTDTPMHYLLFTPFRYPPLRHGSRFGTRGESGIWYGSELLRTALAEVSYYRLLFLEGTSADLGLVETELTAFTVEIDTASGVDLTAPPFDAYEAVLASPSEYRETQALGQAMRADGVEAIRYASARDLDGGNNVAVFVATAFARRQPRELETWHCSATREVVDFARRDYFDRVVHTFQRADFLVGGSLPAPAL